MPAVIALVSITLRAILDPLSGIDNGGRWDYLARLFLAQGSLAGYPPITDHDFEYYSWCDGIPPLVPLLNLWIYAMTGSIAPTLTAVRVAGEAVLLGAAVYRYSRLLWGENGGAPAVAALATSGLALWAVAMGQETGLTAIALVAMLYFLELYRRNPTPALVFWAGVAAGMGGLAGEYGLVYSLVGLLAFAAQKQIKSGGAIFAFTAFGLSAPWYLRNGFITGNPLYPQTLGGLFRGNPVHEELVRSIAEERGLHSLQEAASYFLPLLAVLAGVLIVLGFGGAWRGRRHAVLALGCIILMVALWLWSIPQTAGGWIYSTRVLSPALALLAVLAGWIGSLSVTPRALCFILALAVSADAARRSWVLPIGAFAAPVSVSLEPWHQLRAALQGFGSNPILNSVVHAAGSRKIVVDNGGHHVVITLRGGSAVPLVSPVLAVTFQEGLTFADVVDRLREARIRFVTVTPASVKMLQRHEFWRSLCFRHIPYVNVQSLAVFDLDHLQPLPDNPP